MPLVRSSLLRRSDCRWIFVQVDIVVWPLAIQREDHHPTALLTPVSQVLERTDGTQAGGRVIEIKHETYAGPTAHAVVNCHVLDSVVHVGHRIADCSRGKLVLPEQLPGVAVPRLDKPVKRAVEHKIARR